MTDEIKLLPLELSELSEEVIEVLLLDSTAEPELFDEIARKNSHRPGILKHLLDHSNTPDTTRQFAANILHVPTPDISVTAAPPAEVSPVAEITPEIEGSPLESGSSIKDDEPQKKTGLLMKIQRMKVGERIQLALRGSRDIRSVLIRDSAKEVMMTVLQNPKITTSEIELISKQKGSSEDVLRTIARRREWTKNYSIIHALVSNPKTPLKIAMQHIPTIKSKDLVRMEKDKNISESIRAQAKKLVRARKPS